MNSPVLTIAEITARLGEMTDLPPDWDGGGAAPPSQVAIQRASEIARVLAKNPNAVDPDPNGGVGLWYYGPDRRDVACYCRNNGDVAIVTYQTGMWTDQLTLRLSVTDRIKIEHVVRDLARAIADAREGASACPA